MKYGLPQTVSVHCWVCLQNSLLGSTVYWAARSATRSTYRSAAPLKPVDALSHHPATWRLTPTPTKESHKWIVAQGQMLKESGRLPACY